MSRLYMLDFSAKQYVGMYKKDVLFIDNVTIY